MLMLEMQPGQSVQIGDNVVVTLRKKTGRAARLAFDADKSVSIKRLGDSGHKRIVGITGEHKELPETAGMAR